MKHHACARAVCGVASALTLLAACSLDHSSAERLVVRIETSEGTALNLDVSAEDELIVFDLLGQLWTVPLGYGQAEPITDAVSENAEHGFPALSRRGDRVAYYADGPAGQGLWVASTDGDARRRVAGSARPRSSASWSPGGERVGFSTGSALEFRTVAGGEGEGEQLPFPEGLRGSLRAFDWHPSEDRFLIGQESEPLTQSGN